MFVCVTVQIMRWWSSNIGQQLLQKLGYITYCNIIILDPPRTLLTPSNVLLGGKASSCPDTPSTDVHRVSAQDHPPPEHHCTSIPMFPASTLPFTVCDIPLGPSLALFTPPGFPPPPHPCFHQNLFYCYLQMILRYCISAPFHLELPPSLIARLPCTYIKNKP